MDYILGVDGLNRLPPVHAAYSNIQLENFGVLPNNRVGAAAAMSVRINNQYGVHAKLLHRNPRRKGKTVKGTESRTVVSPSVV